ncbi:hypothetical protein PNEG_00377 [Pneumocystis murina B123]|uniref:OPA3-like protein n=1 Tax=Pneumocystis murina (strain B123) TaxID=1069680 RepID=M7NRI7_PNEMU|nr:hypothetical protein PNEG_00377 [Pneumocystis murina B123]EMR11348.1 hypothetical protein PNEG_00377 [Pneumocystis murina B123]
MSLALKIGFLVIKTLSKPIATNLKRQAKQYPYFRKICVDLAQVMHRTESHMKANLLGKRKKTKHTQCLNEENAIERGADFLSESFLFLTAGSLIFYESWKTRKKEQTRRDKVADDIEELQKQLASLKKYIEETVLSKT